MKKMLLLLFALVAMISLPSANVQSASGVLDNEKTDTWMGLIYYSPEITVSEGDVHEAFRKLGLIDSSGNTPIGVIYVVESNIVAVYRGSTTRSDAMHFAIEVAEQLVDYGDKYVIGGEKM